jgi:cobalt/nickel transport system permease protein
MKVASTLLLIMLIAFTPIGAFGVYTGFFTILMIGTVTAHIDPLQIIKRSSVTLPFILAAIILIFTTPGPALGNVPLLNWPVSEMGLIRFLTITCKSLISVQFAILMMATTQFTDVLWALGALHVPRLLVAIFSFMYRYIFLITDEALRLTRARDSRSAVVLNGNPDLGRSVVFRARIAGRMIGSLLLRSYARSERVYQAMVARGYQGEIKQISTPPLTAHDLLIGLIPVVLGLGCTVVSILIR